VIKTVATENRNIIMTDIVGIAYCSKPMSFSFETVDEILAVSRVRNAANGITGALIYDNKTFLQWLEGTSTDVRATWQRISKDDRHTQIKLLSVRAPWGLETCLETYLETLLRLPT
jgi:hypothetical protein